MSSSASRQSDDNTASPQSPVSAHYPFPQYESPSRRSRPTSQYHSRRSSNASSIASIGGVLEIPSQGRENVIVESGNNAISTLLQPPIVRTGLLPHNSAPGAIKPPSTRDIPPVTLTNIPKVDPGAFKPYLTQAGSLYDAFRRAKDGTDQGRGPASRRSSKGEQSGNNVLVHGMQRRASGLSQIDSSNLAFGSPLEAPQPKRRGSGGIVRRPGLTVAPLSTIPTVYFEEDFHLENPRTFDVVSERSEIVRPPTGTNGSAVAPGSSGKKALATNAILQEKLSWYMDTVEIHLISSISSASTSFFAALGSLRELHSEAAQSVAKIKALRGDLAKLDHDMAVGGLKVVALKRRRENMRKLGDAVKQLQRIVEAVALCEEQVDQGDIEVALKGLTQVERLMAGEPEDLSFPVPNRERPDQRDQLVDLRGIKALEGAGNDIAYLRRRIGKAFETRFMNTLLGDLRHHVDSVPSSSTFQRWDKASNRIRGGHARTPSNLPAYMNIDGSFRLVLLAQLKGLARSDSIMPAAIAYRDAILKEFKSLIRKHIPSSSDDDAESTTSIATQESRHISQQEKSSILARNLRALDALDAEEMFKKIYSNVGEALRRLGSQVKVLLDITSSLGNPHPTMLLKSPPRSPQLASLDGFLNPEPSPGPPPSSVRQDEIQQALDLSSLLGQAVDIAQAQITKILKVRTDQSTHLELRYFLRYFTLNRLFADECEAVSGRGGNVLKTVVNEHIKAFINHIGDTERQRLVQTMDADRWDAKDFSEIDSIRLSRIIESSTNDVEAWNRGFLIWEAVNGHPHVNGLTTNGNSNGKDKVRNAVIDEQKYILPESAMAVASGIEAFEHLLSGIPSMTQEISSSLIDYLKLFNSRSQQLILGAGATRSAGLKNITTKHLALSSQALSFVISLIPHIREFVRRHSSNSGNLIIEFDKVKRLFQEHQSGIQDKLVDIMGGRAAAHVSSLRKIDWDTSAETPAVNTYMETLVKETATLHKVLSKHLPDMTVQTVMQPVIENYKEQLGRAFGDVAVKTPAGKERLLRDADFFRARISKIDGAGSIGDYLLDIVSEKSVAQNRSPSPSKGELPSSITTTAAEQPQQNGSTAP